MHIVNVSDQKLLYENIKPLYNVLYWRHFLGNKIDLSRKCIICTTVTRITLLNGVFENTFHTKLSGGCLSIIDKALFYAFEFIIVKRLFMVAGLLIFLYVEQARTESALAMYAE